MAQEDGVQMKCDKCKGTGFIFENPFKSGDEVRLTKEGQDQFPNMPIHGIVLKAARKDRINVESSNGKHAIWHPSLWELAT